MREKGGGASFQRIKDSSLYLSATLRHCFLHVCVCVFDISCLDHNERHLVRSKDYKGLQAAGIRIVKVVYKFNGIRIVMHYKV